MLLAATASSAADRPNVVLILCDNLGYGDIEPYGSAVHRTPQLNRLAAEGMLLTDFYVASGVCTPSRAALMTGCYPRRVNMHESDTSGSVLQPVSRKGLHPQEITIAEVLKDAGYATYLIGKWHLGDQPPFLPTRQGFDDYYGIPYSDDMTPREGKPWPELPLMRGERVVEAPADRDTLTKRYTQEAIDWMREQRDRPFFLLLSHAMPGSTRHPFASEQFRGKSANGPWGDSVEEIDWSTGEILDALAELEIDEQTLVIWMSDNGAPNRNPPQGSNLPLKGWGYDTSEGAMRVPFIARRPGRIPAGHRTDVVATAMDLFPTIARLADAEVPQDRIIDGKDIWPVLTGRPNAESPHDAFFYYMRGQLQAVRSGRWKLYLPIDGKIIRGRTRPETEAELYDLKADPRETQNLAESRPEVVDRLMSYAQQARKDLGDEGQPGANQRPAGWVDEATARTAAE